MLKIRKIVQLSGVKRAIIWCFYIAKKTDLIAVTQKSVQLSGFKRAIIWCFYIAKNDLVALTQKILQTSLTCNYSVCNYPETTSIYRHVSVEKS